MSSLPRVVAVLFGRPGRDPLEIGAFNAAGLQGLARAADLPARIETVWEPNPARRTATIEAAAARAELVVAHGGQGEQAVAEVAPAFPDVAFAVTQGRITGPNIAGFEVLQEQSALLAGALAGWWIAPGDTAAHLSGEPVPPGLRGRAGFAAGLAHANPSARLLSGFCGNQHDPDLAARWIAAQAAAGARVNFAMLDGGRAGAIAACKAAGMRAIGNVRDWTAEDAVFLASAIADNGVAMQAAITAFLSGDFADRRIGLEAPEAVRLALAADVPPALAARLDQLREAILQGALTVPEAWAGAEWAP
ncbi:BMP family ABC transporter substrate-binding protein [Falsiroseomonas tokyonensis]|uniref:BMP family ABC transporter substrate-binding protein n=1 Tax=Falsiroseomonas tokyonensis TaxID=430521 RepID=A0ABV7C0S8_9PROT|nr:BMP family ABC transporter substrate-binding protein [Falsiroseomonas tokyonensis]MBU8539905.1 BMP family ABC transporter substrate-binding protein [Falsiroseomonas tokyonensis]